MYSLTPSFKNVGKTEGIYIKQDWVYFKFKFHFLSLKEFINKLRKTCFPFG